MYWQGQNHRQNEIEGLKEIQEKGPLLAKSYIIKARRIDKPKKNDNGGLKKAKGNVGIALELREICCNDAFTDEETESNSVNRKTKLDDGYTQAEINLTHTDIWHLFFHQPSTPSPQPTAQSPNDALMATMTQIANLLSGFQKQFPPTNNQLRTSSNSRTHATVHDGHIVTEPIQRKAPGNVGNTGARGKKVICYNCRGEGHVARQCKEPKKRGTHHILFKDKGITDGKLKEKGDVSDAKSEAFLR
ncbi:integrase, catalytic region, zinc finger, CCHC-type containing protein [Tanacetum coccineum]